MDREKLLDRIRKLLRLAESSNVHEAATAAAQAQALMARHRIEAAALATDDLDDLRDHRDTPLASSKRLRPWKTQLANGVARANGCRIYLHTRGSERAIVLVGRADDAVLVRVLYAELEKRVEALTRKHGAGRERSFCNAFRLGMVVTLAERLAEASAEARRVALEGGATEGDDQVEIRSAEGPTPTRAALAVARLDANEAALERFMDERLRLTRAKTRSLRADAEGFALGRRVGHQVSLPPTKPDIPR